MDKDHDSLDIKPVDMSMAIDGLRQPEYDERRKKRSRQKPRLKKEVRDHFQDLSDAAGISNNKLKLKGLPYRFHLYEDSNEVFIDLVVLDEQGQIVEEKRKNISHQDFSRIIEEIESNEGLFFDGMA